ncbi:hypothetical protein [Thermomonospora amylolytica]|uniref:hypothetical protein n=1 Tax=Thermomonospora amylolytica TaxID=1411117 RepID=UPI0018E52F05|nr:hypothetical protein [Thermomonospora amylolytica]
MTGTMRVPRSRGAFSGLMLVLLGLWGGLIPFVGPYADFAFSPDEPWHVTDDRLLLSVAPAAATVLGGLIVLAVANRAAAILGAWLAVLGGAWFVVGGPLSVLWNADGVGTPLGGEARQVAEQLGFFTGLGTMIVFFAALALGRFAVVGVREARLAEELAEHDARREEPWEAHPPAGSRPEGVTQPMARPQGRYALRPDQAPPAEPAEPADHRVAGEPGAGRA